MSTKHLDVELRFDVDDAVPWVDLGSLPGVVTISPPTVSGLEATYYDTDRWALARAGITLRRLLGGSDGGWRLKLPAGSGDQVEHGEAPGDAGGQVPPTLLDLVRAWVRDHELRLVATVGTTRTSYRLFGVSNAVLAEAADDVVSSQSHGDRGGVTVSHWREWGIELVDGQTTLIEAAGGRMRKAGARVSPWSSQLERALGGRMAAEPVPPTFGELTPHSRAGDVVHAHLIEQVDAILIRDWAARHDEPDAVHKMRVATRRLRSALATFRPLLDRAVTDPLRVELKWIAGELGGARDAEVLRMRLLDELAHEPDDMMLGPITSLIEAELRADHGKAHDALVEALNSERYYRLLDRLDALAVAPPFTRLARGRAEKVLTRRVRESYGRVARLVSAGPPEQGAHGHVHSDEWYHEIRKASKRLRYAAESVVPALGASAITLAGAAEALQEVLGEHQDSVVARRVLRELGARLDLDGDNSFTIGRLHALEQARGDKAVLDFRPAWEALSAKRTLRWLRK